MSDRSSWESRKLRYWSECSGQSRRTGHPTPAASPAQARLESLVLERLGTPPDLCAHPFGITSLSSTATSLTLHLDAYMGLGRYSFPEHCLSRAGCCPRLPHREAVTTRTESLACGLAASRPTADSSTCTPRKTLVTQPPSYSHCPKG
ncbi:hypothetical protein ACFQ71_36120 [Streptomyces sp. NPDC056534]|uniref:hypothetical protein n=1 Tax=Streptomyces sp. NPDC056534 TaxID=3345857 RepID=UPI00368F8718